MSDKCYSKERNTQDTIRPQNIGIERTENRDYILLKTMPESNCKQCKS